MNKYVLVYSGGLGMREDPAEQQAVMAAWGTWYGSLGASIVDPGAPFAQAAAVSTDSAGQPELRLNGYTVVSAVSLDDATGMARGCPVVGDGGTVDVYECIDMEAAQ